MTAVLGAAMLLVIPVTGHAEGKKFKHPMVKEPAVAVWRYKPHGEMLVAAMITNVQDKVAVCGLWTISKRLSPYVKETGLDRKTRGNANVVVEGKVVLNSLRSFKRVPMEEFAVGTSANCKVTRHDWQPSYTNKKVKIRTPATTVLN